MNDDSYDWVLAPHMIETSYLYLKASELMWSHSISISIANAALALEILLKSFNCKVVSNDGLINEKLHMIWCIYLMRYQLQLSINFQATFH
jgi:hypothetical protein